MTELKQLVDNCCAECGSKRMMLAQDFTEYSPCEFDGNEWMTQYTNEQESEQDEAIRFFCADCGTRHTVPEELP